MMTRRQLGDEGKAPSAGSGKESGLLTCFEPPPRLFIAQLCSASARAPEFLLCCQIQLLAISQDLRGTMLADSHDGEC